MRLRSYTSLLSIDAADSLRPPGFDLMLILVAALSAVLTVLQPVTDPASLTVIALDPTLAATALFLAFRAGAGLTSLAESGILQVYLAYPVSRAGLALTLWASRILAPALILVLAPVTVAAVIHYPIVAANPARLAAAVAGYLLQALLYGTGFALIALKSRNSGMASLLSLAFYFTYTATGIILIVLSASLGKETLGEIGYALLLYRAVTNYLHSKAAATLNASTPTVTLLGETQPWQLAVVPALLAAMLAAYILYYTRRLEV
ncbi:hypothetical protein [Stetteria hydrogenophila]